MLDAERGIPRWRGATAAPRGVDWDGLDAHYARLEGRRLEAQLARERVELNAEIEDLTRALAVSHQWLTATGRVTEGDADAEPEPLDYGAPWWAVLYLAGFFAFAAGLALGRLLW